MRGRIAPLMMMKNYDGRQLEWKQRNEKSERERSGGMRFNFNHFCISFILSLSLFLHPLSIPSAFLFSLSRFLYYSCSFNHKCLFSIFCLSRFPSLTFSIPSTRELSPSFCSLFSWELHLFLLFFILSLLYSHSSYFYALKTLQHNFFKNFSRENLSPASFLSLSL